jgi:hypothetical protein
VSHLIMIEPSKTSLNERSGRLHVQRHCVPRQGKFYFRRISPFCLSPADSQRRGHAPPATHSPMSSKRGRKRNDNLPPNRARDVQRAFLARRAAHLPVNFFCLRFDIHPIVLPFVIRLWNKGCPSSRRRTFVCVKH